MSIQKCEEIFATIVAGNEAHARALLQECNDAYYGDGTSLLTDAEFDRCAAKYTGHFGIPLRTAPTIATTAVTKTMGRTDRQAGVPHDWPLLSGWLSKAASMSEVQDWLSRTRNEVNAGNLAASHELHATVRSDDLTVSPKWDGMSIVITYNQFGFVQRALTRGDNGLGVDVTRVFANESHFSGHDFEVPRFGVKYEVVMSWSALDNLNVELGLTMKNPRNAVAGIVSSDNSNDRRPYLTLVPLDIEWDDRTEVRQERILIMSDYFCERDPLVEGQSPQPALFTGNGENTTPFFWYSITNDPEYRDVQEIYDTIFSWRNDDLHFDFMIDGIVVEYITDEAVTCLGGRVSDCPAYAIAAKFPSMTGNTEVVSIDFDVGNTGRRTPVVNFKPITLDGRTFSRTSISNMIRFDALNLCVGTPIIVEIRGDVLGWINRAGPDPDGATLIPCPEGLEFTYNHLGQRVFAFESAPLEGRCERMMIKMGVKGIRLETFKKLVDAGLITSIADCFRLVEEQIAGVSGLGDTSAEFICTTIEKKLRSGLWDWEILASVGILNIGRTLSKEALRIWTLPEMLNSLSDNTSSVCRASLSASLGTVRSAAIIEGITEYKSDIEDLMSLGPVHTTKNAQAVAHDGPVYKIVITGELNLWPDRDVFKNYVETLGHKVVGSISGKTDYLVTNTPDSGTVKNRKAQDLGVRIITEEQAIEILGLARPEMQVTTDSNGVTTESLSTYRQVSLDDL